MKIIDLLNKIANGEELPKRIMYDRFNYIFDDNCDNYVRIDDEDTSLNWNFIALNRLDSEVEILDNKKIEKLKKEKIISGMLDNEIQYIEGYKLEDVGDKINEIIDKINEVE